MTGAVASKRVTEAFKGQLSADGNRAMSANAEAGLTVRPGEGPKGSAVRRLKWYASWVQNVVRQFGPYLSWALDI